MQGQLLRLNYNEKSKRIGNNFQFASFPPTFVGLSCSFELRSSNIYAPFVSIIYLKRTNFCMHPEIGIRNPEMQEVPFFAAKLPKAPGLWEGMNRLIKLLMFFVSSTEEVSRVSVGVPCLPTISQHPAAE